MVSISDSLKLFYVYYDFVSDELNIPKLAPDANLLSFKGRAFMLGLSNHSLFGVSDQ